MWGTSGLDSEMAGSGQMVAAPSFVAGDLQSPTMVMLHLHSAHKLHPVAGGTPYAVTVKLPLSVMKVSNQVAMCCIGGVPSSCYSQFIIQ